MGELKHVDQDEMEARLHEAFSHDPESSFRGAIVRFVSDPAKPRDANNWPRLHPSLMMLALAGLAAIGVFLYFGLSHS